jgi:hypothetical protein
MILSAAASKQSVVQQKTTALQAARATIQLNQLEHFSNTGMREQCDCSHRMSSRLIFGTGRPGLPCGATVLRPVHR